MKEKVFIAGASGALGFELVKLMAQQGYNLRLLTHSAEGAQKLSPYSNDIWKADASKGESEIAGITSGIDIVISALGNSISLFTPNEKSFYEVDYQANRNILKNAEKNEVKRFLYISIRGADSENEFKIPKAHQLFEKDLKSSALNFSIFRPVGYFSGLHDLAIMAKRKVIPVIGDGKAKTNSIFHGDMAKFILDHLHSKRKIMEVGGPEIHTRLEMAQMIKDKIGGEIIKVPNTAAELGTALLGFFDDIPEKLNYFKYITTHDMIAEKHGTTTFNHYLKNLDKNQLP